MSKVLVTESHLEDIADAIRLKNGLETEYRPGDMAAAIAAIPSGGITPTGTISITQNGTVDVTNYASASVNVSGGGGADVCQVKTKSTGGNDAALTVSIIGLAQGSTTVKNTTDVSFWPFYNHEYEYLDLYDTIRISYTSPYWTIKALRALTDISTQTAYSSGDAIKTWDYRNTVNIVCV